MYKKFLLSLLLVVVIGSTVFAGIREVVGRNQKIFKVGDNVEITSNAEVLSAVAIGGSIVVAGTVWDDVVAIGGSVLLKDTAVVEGNVVSVGGDIKKDKAAIVKGDITSVALNGAAPMVGACSSETMLRFLELLAVLSMIGFVVLVVILVALFTPQLGQISSTVEKRGVKSFLTGVLAMLLFVPLAVLLLVSIVGIPLILVLVIVFAAALLLGYIGAAHFVGKKVMAFFKITGKSMLAETMTGVILLFILAMLPVLGVLIKLIVGCIGLGAAVLTRFGTQEAA